jgi:hypothetical protein
MLRTLALSGTALVFLVGQASAFTNKIETFPDYINLECSSYSSTERDFDRDPAYKVNVTIAMNNNTISDYNVTYTLRSGKVVDRSNQYQLNEMHRTRDRFEWFWSGNRGSLTMVGATWKNNTGWWYGEQIFNQSLRGRREYAGSFMCHPVDAEWSP